MNNRPRFLCVEPVEDRVTPSFVAFSPTPPPMSAWGVMPVDIPLLLAHTGEVGRVRSGEMDFASRMPAFDSVEFLIPVLTDRSAVVVTISNRFDSSSNDPAVVLPSKLPDSPEPVRSAAYTEPADLTKVTAARPSVSSTQAQPQAQTSTATTAPAAVATPTVRLTPPANGASTSSYTTGLTVPPASFVPLSGRSPQEIRGESPPGWPLVAGGLISPEVPVTAADSSGKPTASTDSDTKPAPRPAESAIDRAIDAIFPDGIPFIGAVSVDPLPAGASALLARFGTLAETATDGLTTPERWAWVSAVALTSVGVLASARPRRRALLATPGTGSDLARWEDRHDGGST